MQSFMLLSESGRLTKFSIGYNVFCVLLADIPVIFCLWNIVPPPSPVYQDPTCTDNFLYRDTSLISAASWYTGGNVL